MRRYWRWANFTYRKETRQLDHARMAQTYQSSYNRPISQIRESINSLAPPRVPVGSIAKQGVQTGRKTAKAGFKQYRQYFVGSIIVGRWSDSRGILISYAKTPQFVVFVLQ